MFGIVLYFLELSFSQFNAKFMDISLILSIHDFSFVPSNTKALNLKTNKCQSHSFEVAWSCLVNSIIFIIWNTLYILLPLDSLKCVLSIWFIFMQFFQFYTHHMNFSHKKLWGEPMSLIAHQYLLFRKNISENMCWRDQIIRYDQQIILCFCFILMKTPLFRFSLDVKLCLAVQPDLLRLTSRV